MLIVSVDGGCDGVRNVKAGVIAATSQQYPLKMAQLGVDAGVDFAKTGRRHPATPIPASRSSPTSRMKGVDSKDTKFGLERLLGLAAIESLWRRPAGSRGRA